MFEKINWADVTALGVIGGTIMKVLPAMAALLAVVYYAFIIYDRIRYGPELENYTIRKQRAKRERHNGHTGS